MTTNQYETFCAIWYHLYNFKKVKYTHEGVLLLLCQLMNNAVFRKTMENVRKYRDIKLNTTERRNYLVSVICLSENDSPRLSKKSAHNSFDETVHSIMQLLKLTLTWLFRSLKARRVLLLLNMNEIEIRFLIQVKKLHSSKVFFTFFELYKWYQTA